MFRQSKKEKLKFQAHEKESSEKQEIEPLLDFNPHIRSFIQGGMIDFPDAAAEMDVIDDQLGTYVKEVFFKSEAGQRMNALINQEKGAALGDPSQAPLSREEQDELKETTQMTQILYFTKAVALLENALTNLANNKFPKAGEEALSKYIKFLNSKKDKNIDNTGRQLAATLKFVYDNQRGILTEKGHAFLEPVQKIQTSKEKELRKKEIQMERRSTKLMRADLLSRSKDYEDLPTPRTAERPLAKSFDNLDNFFGAQRDTGDHISSESNEKNTKSVNKNRK